MATFQHTCATAPAFTAIQPSTTPRIDEASNLQGSHPLSKVATMRELPSECTEGLDVSFGGADAWGVASPTPEGSYIGVIPTSLGMEPALPYGQFVIMRECRTGAPNPQDGEIVQAFVLTRPTPAPRCWWQVWRSREVSPWVDGECNTITIPGFVERQVLRRYGHDATGRVTLTADADGFTSWTEGNNQDGQDVSFHICAVASPYKALLHSSSGVFCVASRGNGPDVHQPPSTTSVTAETGAKALIGYTEEHSDARSLVNISLAAAQKIEELQVQDGVGDSLLTNGVEFGFSPAFESLCREFRKEDADREDDDDLSIRRLAALCYEAGRLSIALETRARGPETPLRCEEAYQVNAIKLEAGFSAARVEHELMEGPYSQNPPVIDLRCPLVGSAAFLALRDTFRREDTELPASERWNVDGENVGRWEDGDHDLPLRTLVAMAFRAGQLAPR